VTIADGVGDVRFVSNLNFLERLVIDESRGDERATHAPWW
jgi:hypothetical protein